ncbi:GNAT family N-acetyltransferase [Pseudooceanicola onchidii]|uniref:GNAT family N-acetyltransferase n=1 Tax=Pseudooceanicola onchidii TaxID=2562279 RepID=UPI001F0D6EAD|nr:GNAT family N-acetyltransferase [Pseudooceanicola onchidii]
MTHILRPATATDEPAVRTCAELAYARYVPLMGRKPAPMVADFAAQIAADVVRVAMDGDRLLGFIVFYEDAGAMLLENVAVHPDAAGRGIGKALIGLCEDTARHAGLPAVRLYTNIKMADNLGIYPRLGYVETDRRIEDGFHRVYFEKPLSLARD